jgi:hypothetical protein
MGCSVSISNAARTINVSLSSIPSDEQEQHGNTNDDGGVLTPSATAITESFDPPQSRQLVPALLVNFCW